MKNIELDHLAYLLILSLFCYILCIISTYNRFLLTMFVYFGLATFFLAEAVTEIRYLNAARKEH